MKTSETLYAAARYIRKHGWRVGTDENNGPRPCCMLDAAYRVINETGENGYLYAFKALYLVTEINPADFNDFHCKTAYDAIAALEIAADIAAAEGN